MFVRNYMDQNVSTAMLASKRSAVVTPEVNLRIFMHAGDDHSSTEIHPGFETKGKHQHKSKTGASVTPPKGLISSKIFKKMFQQFKKKTWKYCFWDKLQQQIKLLINWLI